MHILSERTVDSFYPLTPPPEDPRVEAVAEVLYDEIGGRLQSDGGPSRKAQWEGLARRILAAADAAEGGR